MSCVHIQFIFLIFTSKIKIVFYLKFARTKFHQTPFCPLLISHTNHTRVPTSHMVRNSIFILIRYYESRRCNFRTAGKQSRVKIFHTFEFKDYNQVELGTQNSELRCALLCAHVDYPLLVAVIHERVLKTSNLSRRDRNLNDVMEIFPVSKNY